MSAWAKCPAGTGRKQRGLFWRLFATYLLLILLPVLAASLITYAGAIRVIERQAAESHMASMATVARTTDLALQALERRVIAVLASPPVERMMRALPGSPGSIPLDTLSDLQLELRDLLNSESLVCGAYLYFVDPDVVISNTFVGDAAYFFQRENVYASQPPGSWRAMLASQRLSAFGGAEVVEKREPVDERVWGRQVAITVISSYPFHVAPRAFLVVHLAQEALARAINLGGDARTATAIIDAEGRLIAKWGDVGVNAAAIPTQAPRGSSIVRLGRKTVQAAHVRSSVNDWIYLSLADLGSLRAPAAGIRTSSMVFVVFFLVVGVFVSWRLSLRLYRPIHEIRLDLERSLPAGGADAEPGDGRAGPRHDDISMIRGWSRALVTRNQELQSRVQDIGPFIQESMLNRLLTRQLDGSPLEAYGKLVGLEIPVDGPKAVIVVGYRFHPEVKRRLPEIDRVLRILELRNDLREGLTARSWICEPQPGFVACIVDLGGGGPGLRDSADKVVAVLRRHREWLSTAVGAGTVESSALELWRSWEAATRRLAGRQLVVEPQVLWEDDQSSAEAFLTAEDVGHLQEMLALESADALRQSIGNIMDRHLALAPPAHVVLDLAHDVLNTVTRLVSERGGGDCVIRRNADLAAALEESTRVSDLLAVFSELCRLVPLRSAPRLCKAALFAEAKDYIAAHSTEPLTIDQLSERYGMSAGHFSRCFKEHVGEKYVDFVNRIRVERAKELLAATDDKLELIARAVGYPADKSFIVIFKRYVGVTPGQYRAAARPGTAVAAETRTPRKA